MAVGKNICHVLLTAIAQAKKATATHIPRKIKLKMELKEKDFEDTDMDEDIEEDEGFDTEYFNEDFTIKIAFKLGGFVDFLL